MLVNILKRIITVAGKKPDEYLYENGELDCYVRDVLAADGKETHNTDKKNSTDPEQRHNLNEFPCYVDIDKVGSEHFHHTD